ncbi:MAG: hypothetical protein RJB38_1016 [Pseudomonadota bacterium]
MRTKKGRVVGSTIAVAMLFGAGVLQWKGTLRRARNPAQVESQYQGLGSWITGLREKLKSSEFDVQQCEPIFSRAYQDILELDPQRENREELKREASVWIRAFFLARQELRDRLQVWTQVGQLSEGCVDRARDLNRVLRYTEEYLAEHSVGLLRYDPKNPAPYLAGQAPYLQLSEGRSALAVEDLKSGDLLVSRGNAFASAAIARMAQVDGQFSHVAFVYVEPSTRKAWVMEAHIEVGSTIRPYEEYAKDGNFRVMALRARSAQDQQLAEAAAALEYQRLRKAQKTPIGAVPYDFGMRLDDSSELFCTEIVFEAFQNASERQFQVPLFLSRIEPKNRDFLDRLGIHVQRSFLPSDLDIDPRFEVLAEWRDLARIRLNRYKDAVLDRFYAWADDHDYRLQGDLESLIKKTVVWNARRWPLFSDLLKKKFPLNMSPRVLETITVLDNLGEVLADEAQRKDDASFQATGLRLTVAQLAAVLDAYRLRDLQKWKQYRRSGSISAPGRGSPQAPVPDFHLWYAPKL